MTDMLGMVVALRLIQKDMERSRQKRQREFNKFMRAMDRRNQRSLERSKIDRAFYDIGFATVPYRSGRVPDGGVVYEPKKGDPLVFTSYRDAEGWLKKAGFWKE